MCVCVRVVLYEEEKEQKSEETFSPEFSFLFLSLPETRERRTRDRNNTQVIHIYRETSEGKREREMSAPATTKGPSSSSLGEKRLLKIKVRSQDPVGEYEFSLCATVRYVVLTRKRVRFFSLRFVLL